MSETGYRILDHRGRTVDPVPSRSAPTRSVTSTSSRPAKRGYGYTGGFSAAQLSTSRSFVPGIVQDSPRDLTPYTRNELVRISRWLKKNVGMIRGVAKCIQDHSIGPCLYPIPNTADDNWNEAAWDWIQSCSQSADVAGRLTLGELQRMRVWHKFFDGEIFTLLSRDSAGLPKFQIIRSHNCDSFEVDEADGWADGVQADDFDRRLAYRFRLKGDKYKTVPARSIIHSYMLEDADQRRGIPSGTHGLNDAHDIFDALGLTKDTIKEIARRGIVIKTDSGEDEDPDETHFQGDTDSDSDTDAGNPTDDVVDDTMPLTAVFGGGEIQRLRKDEELQVVTDDRPSPAFTGFIDFLGRGITQGSGMPYEFAWNRQAFANSAAIRLSLEQVRVAVQDWRDNEAADTLPLYSHWISCGIDLGILKPRPDQFKVEWLAGAPDVSIDRGAAAADIEDLKAGLATFKRLYARQGLWWKRELRQKAAEAVFIRDLAIANKISEDRIHQLAPNNPGKSDGGGVKDPNAADDAKGPNA